MFKQGDIIKERYQLKNTLTSSGKSISYLADDLSKEAEKVTVFIKILQPRYFVEKRFNAEIATLKKIGTHDQIPSLIDAFRENEYFILVHEFINGEPLSKIVERKIFTEREIINFLFDVLKILDFVHNQNVIHRDITPSNIIRRKSDQKFILVDFGAVKEINTMALDPNTKNIYSQVIGTPGYMPPEQYNGKPKYNSDLYALGRTAIFALTGKLPLELENRETGKLDNWQNLTTISENLATILNKMMTPKYSERYQSVEEVINDLKPLAEVGKIIGEHYQITNYIEEKIGQKLYLAKNTRTNPPTICIIKQFIPQSQSYAREEVKQRLTQQRFNTELNFLRRLSNEPQIPKLLDHFEENDQLYLVEEFREGISLKEEFKEHKLREEQVIQLLRDVLYILDIIHKQGFIHRDIQPSNLFRSESDQKIMLTDISLVQETSNSSDNLDSSYLKRLGGEQGYRAPEQMSGRATFSSDIYSLGIVAIEALTGLSPNELPFHKATGEINYESLPPIPPKLKTILQKMTAFDLSQRYNSTSEVLMTVKAYRTKAEESSFAIMKPSDWFLILLTVIFLIVVCL
jgi:serine/threonine protein kinase